MKTAISIGLLAALLGPLGCSDGSSTGYPHTKGGNVAGVGGTTDPAGTGGGVGADTGGAPATGTGGGVGTDTGGSPAIDTSPRADFGVPACGDPNGTFGVQKGDVMENFTLTNQHGETVRLSDYCDKVVYIAVSHDNCGICVGHAKEYEKKYAKYGGNAVYLDIMYGGGSDAATWASLYSFVNVFALDDPEAIYYERMAAEHSFWDGSTGHAVVLEKGGVIHQLTDGADIWELETDDDYCEMAPEECVQYVQSALTASGFTW